MAAQVTTCHLAAARVVVESQAFVAGPNATVVVLRRAAIVESIGISTRVRKGTTMMVARREELRRAGGKVIIALGVSARTNAVIVLNDMLG